MTWHVLGELQWLWSVRDWIFVIHVQIILHKHFHCCCCCCYSSGILPGNEALSYECKFGLHEAWNSVDVMMFLSISLTCSKTSKKLLKYLQLVGLGRRHFQILLGAQNKLHWDYLFFFFFCRRTRLIRTIHFTVGSKFTTATEWLTVSPSVTGVMIIDRFIHIIGRICIFSLGYCLI